MSLLSCLRLIDQSAILCLISLNLTLVCLLLVIDQLTKSITSFYIISKLIFALGY